MSDLRELSRADLVQVAKDEGVKASGRSEEIIERIEAKRAERAQEPASSSVDGARQEPGDPATATAQPGDAGDADGAAPFTLPPDEPAEPVVINTLHPADPDALKAVADAALSRPEAAPGDELLIRRETGAAWWCPMCDNSQTHALKECGGCGALRDGDVVVAA